MIDAAAHAIAVARQLSRFALAAVVCLAGFTRAGATTKPDPIRVQELTREFGARLERSHYLARGPAQPIELPDWKGFALQRYRYTVTDKNGATKSADVVLLLPSAEQISRWIVEAVVEVRGDDDASLARKAFENIIGQSGGQFPVAGVVYEDILPPDGVNEAYCFRDGVTVAVEGVKHRQTEPLTADQIEASIHGKVTRVFTYARIASTTPRQFIDAGGDAAVLNADGKPSAAWPAAIRRAFQAACESDRNELIVAWIKANAAKPSTLAK